MTANCHSLISFTVFLLALLAQPAQALPSHSPNITNITDVLSRPLPDDPDSAATVESYTTNPANNRLESITGPTGTRSFTYDPRGNLTGETRAGGISISAGHDRYGKPANYSCSRDASLSHAYNGMENRVVTNYVVVAASLCKIVHEFQEKICRNLCSRAYYILRPHSPNIPLAKCLANIEQA